MVFEQMSGAHQYPPALTAGPVPTAKPADQKHNQQQVALYQGAGVGSLPSPALPLPQGPLVQVAAWATAASPTRPPCPPFPPRTPATRPPPCPCPPPIPSRSQGRVRSKPSREQP